MAIDPTSSLTANAAQALDLQGLLNVLLAEIRNPNPLDRDKGGQNFMAQIAQFASLDTQQQLNQNIIQLLTVQALGNSVGLVGKTVSALTSDGRTITGEVTAVTLTNGAPRLTIDTGDGNFVTDIAIGQLQTVRP